MNNNFKLIQNNWKNLITKLKENYSITDVAFKTWIVPLELQKLEDNTLYIKCNREDIINVLDSKYKTIFQVHIEENLNLSLNIVFTSKDLKNPTIEYNNELFIQNNLNPRFTFETFITGENNSLAHAAALKVSEEPGYVYNPFFIFGGAGLGKTHLMNAIAHKILKDNPNKKVLYVTSEQFTNELIDSIRNTSHSNTAFRNKYRSIDVLLIDDIQFIIGKESTQEEFFHTFNTLYGSNKQIIISSDKPPRELETLEDRLKSRFQSGLIVDIQIPNFETRMAILKMYEDIEDIHFSYPILEYIVTNIKSNVRTLEGAFKTLIASTSLLYGREYASQMTLDEAKILLKDSVTPNSDVEITPDLIIDTIAQHYKVSSDDIKGKSKNKEITLIRHISMYLCQQLTEVPLKDIGKLMSKRDHSTVIYGRDRILNEMNKNNNFKNEIEVLIKKIKP